MAVKDFDKAKAKKERKRQEEREIRHREDKLGRQDRNVLKEYEKDAPVLDLHQLIRWRTSAIRIGKGGTKVVRRLDDYIESVYWEDASVTLKGGISVRLPDREETNDVVRDGDLIKLEVKTGTGWREVWRMRVWEISEELSDGTISLQLSDDFRNLQESKVNLSYKKEKKGVHKKGWLASGIVRDIARLFRFKTGKIAETRRRIEDLEVNGSSPLDVIVKAYKLEKEETGRSYVMRWQAGKLNIARLRRAPYLYSMRQEIVEAVVGHGRQSGFYTVLKLKGNIEDSEETKSENKGKGKNKKHKRKPIEVEVKHPAAIKRYGYIVREETHDKQIRGKKELEIIAQRQLAKTIRTRTDNEITLTHPGIPWVRRGDAVRINLPEFGFRDAPRPWRIYKGGDWSILFVKSANHTLSSGSYTMELNFGIEDPIAMEKEDVRQARDKKKREEKQKARKKEKKKEDDGP